MQMKAEKYAHRYDPHPVYVHRDIHHHYESPHTIQPHIGQEEEGKYHEYMTK